MTRIDHDQRNSAAEYEWHQIAMQRESDVVERGNKWLVRYGNLPVASECLLRLLEIKPTAHLKRRALNWLTKFPENKHAPRMTAVLLEFGPRNELLALAKKYLMTAERDWFEVKEPDLEVEFGLSSLMRQILKAHPRSRLFDLIAAYVVKYPANYIWTFVIPSSTRGVRNRRLESLVVRWINLNVGNPELFLLSLPSRIQGVEVIESCFNWVRNGGRKSNFMPQLLTDLLRNAKRDKALLRRIVRFSRKWAESNHNHDEVGRVYGALLHATEARADLESAKSWYKAHPKNKTSSHIVTTSLEHAFWTSTKPDLYFVKRAKLLVRDVEFRTPRLIGALVSVAPDSEVIGLAKDICKRNKLMWILTRMLLIAPDAELIDIARNEYDRHRGTSLEPDLLCSLLKVDPNDLVTRRRARRWMRQNAKHKNLPLIEQLLKSDDAVTDKEISKSTN